MHPVSRCQEGRDGNTPVERLHGKKPTQEFVQFGEKEQGEPQIWLAWDAKQQRRVFHWECRWCVQSSWNLEIGTSGQMGHRGHQQRDWNRGG